MTMRCAWRAVGTALIVLVTASCTTNAVNPPTVTPTPTTSSPTSESAREERERVDFEEAEGAYRRNSGVLFEFASRGTDDGAKKKLAPTSTGDYLAFQLKGLRQAEELGLRLSTPTVIVGTRFVSWNDGRIRLVACEDNSKVRVLDKAGKDVTPKTSRNYVQTLEVVDESGAWKVSTVTSVVVDSFRDQAC